ncbi:MAG: glycosyltransferase [Methanomassiliicoccaceae archaeon]|nr:glycosyltransferase [Methanomassiliicoccaceae archaeon]
MMPVSVCICAYNEESNIERAIRSVYSQTTDCFELTQVIVVSSESTDGTDRIVTSLTEEFPSLMLIRQEKRMGKNFAINEFLDNKMDGTISVLLNADNILRDESSLHYLISPFKDEKVGIVGGHPIPTNDPKKLMGFVAHMVWTMHHNVSMVRPNIGELVAFRDIGIRLPTDMQSDEAIMKMETEKRGYISVYAPNAYILNRGPETASDFVEQRARVIVGETWMKNRYEYSVPIQMGTQRMNTLIDSVRDMGMHPFKIFFTFTLELISRLKAKEHMRRGESMSIWKRVGSTKDLK